MIKPAFTEKTMAEAKNGKYTFWVNPSMTKDQIRQAVADAFKVAVVSVTTMNKKGSTRRNMYGKFISTKAQKKAIVTLKKGQKIDIFEALEKEAKK